MSCSLFLYIRRGKGLNGFKKGGGAACILPITGCRIAPLVPLGVELVMSGWKVKALTINCRVKLFIFS
jgi:hypothetical protein